jgi:glycosyltransferase involved in cell wall biosynthesis
MMPTMPSRFHAKTQSDFSQRHRGATSGTIFSNCGKFFCAFASAGFASFREISTAPLREILYSFVRTPYFYRIERMKLSIIIPAYNEEPTILQVLEKILNTQLQEGIRKEIIVVDDASIDDTCTRVAEFRKLHPNTELIFHRHEKNLGKGAAIRSGIQLATGDFILIQDADLEYDPSDYNSLLKPVLENKADVVYGTRFMGGKPHRILFFWHTIGNKFLTFLSNMLSNQNLTDMENGFKLFRSSVIKPVALEEDRFGFEPEITAKLSRMPGIRFYEVGIAYYGRTYKEGKKINWKDGVKAIYCILKYNLYDRPAGTSKSSRWAIAAIITFLIAGLILAFTAKGTADEGDSIMHYLFARDSFHYHDHFFNHWAKPLFVLVTAPATLAGFTGIKLFNLLASTITIWMAWRIARKLKIPNASFTPVLSIFAPMLMVVTLSGLTEPLFAFWMTAGILWYVNGKPFIATLWLSFLPFVRSEGLIILCVILLYLLVRKYYKYIPLLLVGHVVYAIAGYGMHKDFLWVFNTMSYATLSSAYGKGGWMHFAENLPEVIGVPLTILLIIGILYGCFVLAGKYLFRDRNVVSDEKLYLVYGIFAAYFIGHTVFWALGIFNSFGLLRVLVGVFPLMAIICLEGLNTLTRDGRNRIILYILLAIVVIYPFANTKYSYKWKRDFSLKADQEATLQLADFIKKTYPDYKNHVFYYEAAYPSVVLDIDHFDTSRHRRLRGAFEENRFPDKSFIIWDDWFARVEGFIELQALIDDGRFELIATFEEKDFWGVTRTVKLFRKE